MHTNKNKKLSIISNENRTNFQPNIEVLKDAVVTPWYRNQEQPQVFSFILTILQNYIHLLTVFV